MKKKYLLCALTVLILLVFSGQKAYAKDPEPVLQDYYSDLYLYYDDLDYDTSLGDFNEEDIHYCVTKKPEGSSNGEAIVVAYAQDNYADKTYQMTEITIPAVVKHSGKKYNVTAIHAGAFVNHPNLLKVTLPDSITSIGKGAFWGCWNLKKINMPSKLKEIGEGALGYTYALESVSFPSSVKVIQRRVLSHSGVSKVTIPDSVTEIQGSAFENCYSLKSIKLPSSLKTYEYSLFSGCVNLETVENVKVIKEEDRSQAFQYTKWAVKNLTGSRGDSSCSDHDISILLSLDGKQIKDGYLYFSVGWNNAMSYNLPIEDGELGAYCLCKPDKDGFFVLDKNYATSYGEIIYGNFFYSKEKPKNFLKDYDFWFGSSAVGSIDDIAREIYKLEEEEAQRILAEEGEDAYHEFINNRTQAWKYTEEHKDDAYRAELYSVHFVQGEDECPRLPDDFVYPRYGYFEIPELTQTKDALSFGYNGKYPIAPGKAFVAYEDEEGNRYENNAVFVKGTLTLHPVFVDIDKVDTFTEDFNTLRNYISKWDAGYYFRTEDTVVKTVDELLKRFYSTEVYTQKEGLCIVDADIKLTPDKLAPYGDEGSSGGFAYLKDYVFVRKGKLTIDGMHLTGDLSFEVADGATLELINGTVLESDVHIAKGGCLILDDSSVKGGGFINAGTVEVRKPKFMTGTDSFDRKSISGTPFYNLTSGVINLRYGGISMPSATGYFDQPGLMREDYFTEEDAPGINKGVINVSDLGYIHVYFSQADSNFEVYERPPFVNNGTINITQSRDSHYLFSALSVRDAIMINNGTIKLKTDAILENFHDNYALRADNEIGESVIDIAFAELINNGKLEAEAKAGLGINIHGARYLYRENTNNHFGDDVKYAYFSRLVNTKKGELVLTSNGGTACNIGKNGCMINDGKVTLKDKSDKTADVVTLLIGGSVVNNGTFTNSGIIGYNSSDIYKFSGYEKSYGFLGKKWKGKGSEMLAYTILLPNVGTYDDHAKIYVSGDKKVLVDGISDYLDTSTLKVLLPVNKTVKLTSKYTGYADATKSFKTASSVKAYYDAAFKAFKSGSTFGQISISMKKGKSTVDKSVGLCPLVTGSEEFAKDGKNDAHVILLTDDGKTGTARCMYYFTPDYNTKEEVPDTVKLNGRTYKITQTGEYLGSNSTREIIIGANVEEILPGSIMKSYTDNNLQSIVVKTKKLKAGSIGANAFKNVPASCKITVPKSCLKKYKKLFTEAGLNKKVKIVGK